MAIDDDKAAKVEAKIIEAYRTLKYRSQKDESTFYTCSSAYDEAADEIAEIYELAFEGTIYDALERFGFDRYNFLK